MTEVLEIAGLDVKRRIASGGMSEVFLASRTIDSRPVVVKLAREMQDDQTRERLTREHRLLSAIDNPHVVKVLDYGSF